MKPIDQNILDCMAEMAVLKNGAEIIPALTSNSDKRLHYFIIGLTGELAQAVFSVIAHISHFPNFDKDHRTRISLIDEEMDLRMPNILNTYPGLFNRCHYNYIRTGKNPERIHHAPDEQYGDIMDLEFDFIDSEMLPGPVGNAIINHTTNRDYKIVLRTEGTKILVWANVPPTARPKVFDFKSPANNPGKALRLEQAKKVNRIVELKRHPELASLSLDEIWDTIDKGRQQELLMFAASHPIRERCYGTTDCLNEDITERQRLEAYKTEHRRKQAALLLRGADPFEPRMVPWDELTQAQKDEISQFAHNTYYIFYPEQLA